ncbi:MAG TPA: acyl-CoA dehydrogenase family protein [Actinomycetota bacterium]|jgi:alkylation response protein AidB-like acyl-CoA dehydrogenase
MTDSSFALPEELEEFRGLVREIVEERIGLARAAEIDETDEFPWDVHKLFVESELMAVSYPEEFGGSGGGSLTFAVLIEEISRVSAGCALIPLVSRLGAIPVMLAGSDDLKHELFGGIAKGDHQMSYCLTEPDSGSDSVAMKSRYEKTDPGYRLSGTKRFITGAGVSDAYTVFATRDPAQKAKGISAFVVYADDPGVSFGKAEHKLGIHGSPTREVYLENTDIPADRLIGEESEGFTYAMRTLDYSRPTIAAQALGIAQGAFDFAARYANERQQFGKPISHFEGIQFMLADMAMEIEAARLLVYRAASLVDAKDPRMTEFASMAKCYAGDVAMKVTTDAVQILGGYGYMREYPVERMMRDAKITQIYEGTNQIQRVVIARNLLKRYRGGTS